MSFVPASPLHGRPEGQGVAGRKKRAVPPAYGAHAFHATPPTVDSNNQQGALSFPPPSRSAGTPPFANSVTSTSPVTSLPSAPQVPVMTAPPPFSPSATRHITPSTDAFAQSASSEPISTFPPVSSQPPPPTAGQSSMPPPGTGRRDTSQSSAHRTRRLAAPSASFATEMTSTTVTSQPPSSHFQPAQFTPASAPISQSPHPVFSTMTISSAPSLAPVEQTSSPTVPSPVLSPSMFSPVGKGANLFDSHPEPSSETGSKVLPTIPTSTADFFDFGNEQTDEFGRFGLSARSSSSASMDLPHRTQAQVVNKLFERTPSPSPPPSVSSNATPHRPEISKSAASLFDSDQDFDEPLAFGSSPTPVTASSPAPFVTSATSPATPSASRGQTPTPIGSDLFSQRTIATSMKSDLFDDHGDDFLDISNFAPATQSSPIVAASSTQNDTLELKKEEIAPVNASISTPIVAASPQVDFLTLDDDSSTPLELDPAPAHNAPTTPVQVEAEPKSSTPQPIVPQISNSAVTSSPAPSTLQIAPNTADSLFGDDNGEDLDFGTFGSVPPTTHHDSTPIIAAPVENPLPSTSQDLFSDSMSTPSIPASTSLEKPQEPVSDHPVVQPSTAPIALQSSNSAPIQIQAIPTLPNTELPTEETAPSTSNIVENEQSSSLAPVAMFQPSNSEIVAPPTSSSRSTAPRASGPKRPRHFQYTAGQALPAPSTDMNVVAVGAPPPKAGAHPPLSIGATTTTLPAPAPTFAPVAPVGPALTPASPSSVMAATHTANTANGAHIANASRSEPPAPTFIPPSQPSSIAAPPTFPTAQPPIFAPTPLSSSGHFDAHQSESHDDSHIKEDNGKKGSLFEPLGQLQSRGLSWFKSTLAGVMSPSSDSQNQFNSSGEHQQDNGYDQQPSHSTVPPFLNQDSQSSSALPFPLPSVSTASGAAGPVVPLPRVNTGAKKKAAPRPGPFKSAVAPPTGDSSSNPLAPSFVPTAPAILTQIPESEVSEPAIVHGIPVPDEPASTLSEETIASVPPGSALIITNPATTTTVTQISSNSSSSSGQTQYMDDQFQVSSGLVSIDYSAPSAAGSGLSLADSDPFGSDENVSATDLFTKLRGVKSQPLNGSVEILASPATSQHLSRLSNPPMSSSSETERPSSVLVSSTTSTSNAADMRELEESKAQIASLKSNLTAITSEVGQLKESLRRAETQRDSSSDLVSTLQATERDLRSQISQMLQSHETMSESQRTAMKNELDAAHHQTQSKIAELSSQTSELTSRSTHLAAQNEELADRLAKAEKVISDLEQSKKDLIAEHQRQLSQQSSATNSELQSRINQLEKSLSESQQSLSQLQAQLSSKDAEVSSWRSKLENERSSSRHIQDELEERLSTLQASYESRLSDEAKKWQQKERALNIELQQLRLETTGNTNSEKRHAEEIARITQENERYVNLMQQQAASQTSVIDRLILQNAELVKAVEFARRVLHESKNPDSLGAALSDNERLQDDLDSAEAELATLRQRNAELEFKASHFESEAKELLRRLNSLDYRVIHQQPQSTAVLANGSLSTSSLPSGVPESQQSETSSTSTQNSSSLSSSTNQIAASATTPVAASSASISASSAAAATAGTIRSASPTTSSSQEQGQIQQISLGGAMSPTSGTPSALTAASTVGSSVPTSPGDWQPKSPSWLPNNYNDSSPGKTPSRLPPAASAVGANAPLVAPTLGPVPAVEPLLSAPSVATPPPNTNSTTSAPNATANGPVGNAPAPSPFVVTAPVSQLPAASLFGHPGSVSAVNTLPGIHHVPLSPHINLDDTEEIPVSGEQPRTLPSSALPSPMSTPSSALKEPPKRGLVGRIWQAVTLQ